MAIRLKLTKKWKIIIIVIFVLILGGSGAYLLWRTNQPDTVAPQDSEAGSAGNGACYYCCTDEVLEQYGYCPGSKATRCSSVGVLCGDGVRVPTITGGEQSPYVLCPSCNHAAPNSTEPVNTPECNVGSQCNEPCIWPAVNYCNSDGTCTCKSGDSNNCDTVTPCEPECPTGYEKCTSNCGTDTQTASCEGRCDGCNNKYTNKITCKRVATANTCDSGEWLTKPTGSYEYCDPISYAAKAKDKDGIDKTSVVAKLNNVERPSISFTNETATTVEFSESSTTTECLPVGTYTLDLSWKDKKGATSAACTLTTSFSILAEEQNPDWTITKTAAEQCLENGDAQVTYIIKIKNVGTGTGSITKMVDTLDSKVLASYITGTISYGGLFGSGSITWELEGAEETFAPNEEKSATYTLVIPKTAFGSYTNMVTATPTTGENFSDSVTVEVDCEQDIPQTGLFDSTVAKIVAGVVLLLLGFNLHRADSGFRNVQNSLNKLTISMQDNQSEKRKRNFEKKIVKK